MSTWDVDVSEWAMNPQRTALMHGEVWGIELTEFRTIADLQFWTSHVAGKGWGTGRCIAALVTAFRDINWDRP